jgi:amidase
LAVLAGRDPRDPRSVDAPLAGPEPRERRAALVTRLPGQPLEATAVAAIESAGEALRAAGWAVEEAAPPELARVNELFAQLLASDLAVLRLQLAPFLSDVLSGHLQRLCSWGTTSDASAYRLHTERSRLQRAWSTFFAELPIVIGPTWGRPIWHVDADLDPQSGIELLAETTRFITPGNVLGLPSLALPMGQVNGLPTSVLVYADLWREDLCLAAAEIIEQARPPVLPVEPVEGR